MTWPDERLQRRLLRGKRRCGVVYCSECGLDGVFLDGLCRGCFWERRARAFQHDLAETQRQLILTSNGYPADARNEDLSAGVRLLLAATGALRPEAMVMEE